MAANKVVAMMQRNTHMMAFLLIYTALEWILIISLLLNSAFSYLIEKFASFFGLKAPCILCSRIDHLFEGGKGRRSCRDFLCESHAGEVSKLGFCSKHRRLADAGDMCEDCAASKSAENDRNFSLLSWMERSEQGEKDLRCSCCGVALENGFFSPYLLLKTGSWGVLECVQREKAGLDGCLELEEAEKGEMQKEEACVNECLGVEAAEKGEKQKEEEGSAREQYLNGENFLPSPLVAFGDAPMNVLSSRVEKITDSKRIVPIESIDSPTLVKSRPLEILTAAKEETMAVRNSEIEGTENVTEHEKLSCLIVPAEEPCDDFSTGVKNVKAVAAVGEIGDQQPSEDDGKGNDESNCEISIGSEICDQEQIDQAQFHEIISRPDEMAHHNLNASTATITKEPVTVIEESEPSEQSSRHGKHLKICPILNGDEEGRMMPETPKTPNYVGCFPLHKRFLIERRESGTESLDGSVAGDADNLEPPTIDGLKTALKSERKALIALYAELEEERSASAIAANQTMAMITRLQEEKAAMQMEALHYQRMMEEQSEYDQEALQLLNDLMMKREKEKQDLEKQLMVYRQKIRVYEAMERKTAKGSGSGTTTSSEESDDLSIESHEGQESYQNTDMNEFTGLMEEGEHAVHKHLLHFEEERLSILEQLKALQAKLFTEVDVNHLPIQNGHAFNGDCERLRTDANGVSLNDMGYSERHGAERNGKRLLPLFDVVSSENENDCKHKKISIVEEVHHVYWRLQALEADCEFLKHCLYSIKKGDNGLDLLREILQHLRHLRIMEFNSRQIDV